MNVCSDSQCSKTLSQCVAIESVNYVCEGNFAKDMVESHMFVR